MTTASLSADERTVDDSLASQFQDIEDAMQYYTALHANTVVTITRNGKNFKSSRIPVDGFRISINNSV